MASVRALLALALIVVSAAAARAADAVPSPRPVTVRIQWGGGTPQAWAGGIEVVGPSAAPLPFAWRTLSMDADAAALSHQAGERIVVHHPRPVAGDGVDITVTEWRGARIVVRLGPRDASRPETTVDLPIADVVAAPAQQPLDGLGNRVSARPAPGDALRVTAAAAGDEGFTTAAIGSVRRPGDRLRLQVEPLIATRLQGGNAVELRMRLRPARQAHEIAAQSIMLTASGPAGDASPAGRTTTAFEPVVFDVTLPGDEGVYEVDLEAVERGGLRWSRTLCSRVVQFAAIADTVPEPPPTGDWKLVHELDPGSPRLHERLRRLPGMQLPSVPLPAVSLPTITRPPLTLPKLPSVPLPNVAAMVPRFSGLLATGHSTVIAHPTGPVLQLPPAASVGDPSWEGIVIANAEAGMPHAVEIDYPADQDATIGMTVLEADAVGATVEPRHSGGFQVHKPRFSTTAAPIATHRFVFWPTTRHPLILVSNPSSRSAALISRVRVSAGPARLPVLGRHGGRGSFVDSSGPRLRTYGFLPSPDLPREYGGGSRGGDASGKPTADWLTHVAAARHSAELFRSQGAGGALVTVFAGGAATWPTDLTRQAARWDACGGAVAEHGPHDVLGMLARTYGRHGLGMVAGLRFDAPLPAVESLLASADAAAPLGCVGADGRMRRLADGSVHYNVLDPRVQAAVESIVAEAASRLRGLRAAEGVALVMPHDGWLHLPGVAWALDDETFGRFAATLPAPPALTAGTGRFAERARLVEGPLRDSWLAWRCGEVAAFHARLAGRIGAIDDRLAVYVVPTTLLTSGDLAPSFPAAGGPGGADALRIAGLDPDLLPPSAAERVVFVAPHVHRAAGSLREAAVRDVANRSAVVTRAARRGVALIEEPLAFDVDDVVSHGPFGNATAAGRCLVHAAPAGGGPLAESLARTDAEVVFDTGLGVTCAAAAADRHGYETLPAGTRGTVQGVAKPLAVRTCREGGVTWAEIVNASPAACRGVLALGGRPAAGVDAVEGTSLPLVAGREVSIALQPWAVRAVVFDGGATVEGARVEYDEPVRREIATRIASLTARRSVLETPPAIDVLDNPGFELGVAEPAGKRAAAIAGWELVEPRRGGLAVVPGLAVPGEAGRGLEFSSSNGLATLRSNPFAAPRTGRISVAVWLRVAAGGLQPPLRIAIEGVQDDREYYRFAAVGGLTGGRPLTDEWSQFVLQVDDLPDEPVESMRVRFDLLGPGSVQIDDVRVFDLAFDESQRSQMTRAITELEAREKGGDVAACIDGLEGYWPAVLDALVSDEAVAAGSDAATVPEPPPAQAGTPAERQAGGILDRVRSWWQ